MIDVGGAALLGAAARNSAGVVAASDPSHYERIMAELREHGHVSPEMRAQLAAEAFGTVAAYHAEIAAYLNQISGNTFPTRLAMVLEKVTDLPLRREPAPARRLLPGDHAPERDAGRRDERSRAAPHRSTTCWTSTPRTASRATTRRRPSRSSSTPTRSAWPPHDELVEAYRHALETDPVASFGGIVGVNRSSTGRRHGRSRPTRTRPWWRPASASPRSACCAASRAWSSSRAGQIRPRGCATTASPASTSSGWPVACSSRRRTSSASTAGGSRW